MINIHKTKHIYTFTFLTKFCCSLCKTVFLCDPVGHVQNPNRVTDYYNWHFLSHHLNLCIGSMSSSPWKSHENMTLPLIIPLTSPSAWDALMIMNVRVKERRILNMQEGVPQDKPRASDSTAKAGINNVLSLTERTKSSFKHFRTRYFKWWCCQLKHNILMCLMFFLVKHYTF